MWIEILKAYLFDGLAIATAVAAGFPVLVFATAPFVIS